MEAVEAASLLLREEHIARSAPTDARAPTPHDVSHAEPPGVSEGWAR